MEQSLLGICNLDSKTERLNESKLDNSKGKSPWEINNQNLEVLV